MAAPEPHPPATSCPTLGGRPSPHRWWAPLTPPPGGRPSPPPAGGWGPYREGNRRRGRGRSAVHSPFSVHSPLRRRAQVSAEPFSVPEPSEPNPLSGGRRT